MAFFVPSDFGLLSYTYCLLAQILIAMPNISGQNKLKENANSSKFKIKLYGFFLGFIHKIVLDIKQPHFFNLAYCYIL